MADLPPERQRTMLSMGGYLLLVSIGLALIFGGVAVSITEKPSNPWLLYGSAGAGVVAIWLGLAIRVYLAWSAPRVERAATRDRHD